MHLRPPPTAAMSVAIMSPPHTAGGLSVGGVGCPEGSFYGGPQEVALVPNGGGVGSTNQLIIQQQATQKGTFKQHLILSNCAGPMLGEWTGVFCH